MEGYQHRYQWEYRKGEHRESRLLCNIDSNSLLQPAQPALFLLGEETHSRADIGSPTTRLFLPVRVDVGRADIILRSSDRVDCCVHTTILASSSRVFNDMFDLALSSDNEAVYSSQCFSYLKLKS